MKLAKLSLAAIVAAGAMTTFASAQPLEEAIKGVEFSGFLRYRLNQKEVNSVRTANENDYDFLAKFTAPVTEDIKAVMAFASNSNPGVNQSGSSVASLNVDLAKAFFVYNKDALTVKAGMQAIGHPIFDNGFNGNKGTGVAAMYNAGPVTLVGAYFAGIGGPGLNLLSADSDVATVAAIGTFGPVSAQAWFATLQGVFDSQVMVQADAKVEMVSLTAQFINTDLNGGTDGNFYAIKAGAKFAPVALNIGYTNNDDTQGAYSVAGGDSAVIHPGWRAVYEVDNVASAESIFGDVSASFGQFGLTVGYVDAEIDNTNTDIKETWGQVSYKVAKNLNTYVKYSDMEVGATDTTYFRFEANYSF